MSKLKIMKNKKNFYLLVIMISLMSCNSGLRKLNGTTKIDVAGAKLHVEVSGPYNAPAILMWNGATCSTKMWNDIVPLLDNRFRVVRFDIRGTGQSVPSADPKQYTFEQYANDAATILDKLGIEKAYIFAMAWGSRAALAFSTLKPNRVLKLALFDASIGKADVAAQKEGRDKAIAKAKAAGRTSFDLPKNWNYNANPESVRLALAAWNTFDLPAAADQLKIETLVATGDHDPNLTSSHELVERASNATLVVMENVGHGSVLLWPDLSTEIFLNFIMEN